jgi:hypothetical protein
VKAERRTDYPLCPYCQSKLYGFCPPGGGVAGATLYCSSGECRGANLGGTLNGYDIAFTDLKTIYTAAERRGPAGDTLVNALDAPTS